MSRTFLATLQYDGTGFVGWQRQAAGRSAKESVSALPPLGPTLQCVELSTLSSHGTAGWPLCIRCSPAFMLVSRLDPVATDTTLEPMRHPPRRFGAPSNGRLEKLSIHTFWMRPLRLFAVSTTFVLSPQRPTSLTIGVTYYWPSGSCVREIADS